MLFIVNRINKPRIHEYNIYRTCFSTHRNIFSKITFASLWALTMRIAIHSLDEDESKQTLTNYTAGIISFMYIVNQASMIKFDIFHILAESKVNSVICFF